MGRSRRERRRKERGSEKEKEKENEKNFCFFPSFLTVFKIGSQARSN